MGDVKDAQVTYHDWESQHYDHKWSISFDERCIAYAVGRLRRVVPDVPRFGRVLEIGCGTGFFLLNLAQAGVVGEAHCTDISPGMVEACAANGRRLGVDVDARVADAEDLPYDDEAFDLVVGHAVVHHLPDLDTTFKEMARVLRPGGRIVLAGEPTAAGDRIAEQFKRAGRLTAKLAAVVAGADRVLARPVAQTAAERDAAGLEWDVDLHMFRPRELEDLARATGFVDVRTETEELTASWFGWWTRTLEAMVRHDRLPARYPWFAYRTWQRLYAFDDAVARRFVPSELFYNCVLTATKPQPHVALGAAPDVVPGPVAR